MNIAFVLNLVGAAPASLWVSSDAHKVTTAAAIAAANLFAGLCAWGLPETSGRSLSEAPAAARRKLEALGPLSQGECVMLLAMAAATTRAALSTTVDRGGC